MIYSIENIESLNVTYDTLVGILSTFTVIIEDISGRCFLSRAPVDGTYKRSVIMNNSKSEITSVL